MRVVMNFHKIYFRWYLSCKIAISPVICSFSWSYPHFIFVKSFRNANNEFLNSNINVPYASGDTGILCSCIILSIHLLSDGGGGIYLYLLYTSLVISCTNTLLRKARVCI